MTGMLTNIAVLTILVFAVLGVWQVAWVGHRSRTEARFIVFAANLRRDVKGRHTAHVLNGLRTQLGIVTGGVPTDVAPDADIPASGAYPHGAALAPVAVKARSWLWQQFAHVLIWGEVSPEGDILRLRLATSGGQGGAGRIPHTRELELPAGFGRDHGTLLAAVTALAIPSKRGSEDGQLTELLTLVAGRLRLLAELPPAHFSAANMLLVWHLYAETEIRLDAEQPDTARLKAAITFIYRVLESWPHEFAPFDWAATQARLGDALLRIGEREHDTESLGEAVTAYREARRVWTRPRAPAEWAVVQNSLGLVLWRIGEREGDTARLDEAVTAFREALRERTRARSAAVWMQTRNNLGNALCLLGEREGSMVQLHAAAAIFREILQVAPREQARLDWAMTQHNLGVALAWLGAREASADRLREAVAVFQQALQERTEGATPMEWAATQTNLATALAALGELTNDTATIEQAIAACHRALRVYGPERERAPLEWAGAQNNLGSALALLGEREKSTARLEEAVTCFRAALQEYTRARTPLQWTATQAGLGATFPSLGTDDARSERPPRPVAALKKWARERSPLDRAATQNNLGAALLTLGERQGRTDREAACRTLMAAREVVLGALEVRQQTNAVEAVAESHRHLADIDAAAARFGCR